MMRQRLRARVGDERGFTLIELLVTIILIGILAAIALAVFLNQRDKGDDAQAKSNVTNAAHLLQACAAGSDSRDSYTDCDSVAKLGESSLPIDPTQANEVSNCNAPDPVADVPASGYEVKIVQAGTDCFTLLGTSKSGNVFWYIKESDGTVAHDCVNRNASGCPQDGEWAG